MSALPHEKRRRALASFVAVGEVRDDGTCQAWVESADRMCGKPADLLCARHEKVAERRYEQAVAKERRRIEKRKAERARLTPKWEADLARVEARLDRIDPLRTDPFNGDTAMVNLPLSKRLPSDSRIHELSVLHEKRADLLRKLGRTA